MYSLDRVPDKFVQDNGDQQWNPRPTAVRTKERGPWLQKSSHLLHLPNKAISVIRELLANLPSVRSTPRPTTMDGSTVLLSLLQTALPHRPSPLVISPLRHNGISTMMAVLSVLVHTATLKTALPMTRLPPATQKIVPLGLPLLVTRTTNVQPYQMTTDQFSALSIKTVLQIMPQRLFLRILPHHFTNKNKVRMARDFSMIFWRAWMAHQTTLIMLA